MDFSAEITLALVAGLVTGFIGESQEINTSINCALVLLASNNGADSLALAKNALRKDAINPFKGIRK
ncbi:hypothetical protein L4174_023765 (plasmid) [Photobacterium sp. CCB-ST2H9]|uniref:hypothetical protein n=1 Tax=Photobacterium sp. CCB-ST2H9 TaxID=2912855 RepID=UPI002006374B|nr:hypothetical protein [Photobacterium sp. CCB-ST2H9]UTM60486.1 hypothetical protein L4174_023765 [Photobacterium sp. CCB-ST2H9]